MSGGSGGTGLPGVGVAAPVEHGVAASPAPVATAIPTRERLLRAGRLVVEEQGYAAASVAAIAGRARVANGTLYRHFGSKAELFVEVFRDVCGREVAAMEEAAAPGGAAGEGDPVASVLAALRVFASRALQNPVLAWALLAEPVDPLVDAVRLEYRRTYRALLAGPLRVAVADGRLPPQDPELTAAALVGAAGEVLVGPVSTAGERRGAGRRPAEDATLVDALVALCARTIGAAASVERHGDREPR